MKPKHIKIQFERILPLLLSPSSWAPMISWPVFSMTSYTMISSLVKQNVVPKTVIDVGANIGQFAIASAKLFPNVTVHSFEPNPESAAQLEHNVKSLGNVLVYPYALGECAGEADFHINSHSHSSSILLLAEKHREVFPHAQEVGTIQVKVSTLDTTFAGMQLPSPVLLKLDVQGFEAHVLRGGADIMKRVDHVVLEASFKPMYQGEMLFLEIVPMMERYGFSFLRPVGWLAEPDTGEIIQMDALFQRDVPA